MWRFLVGGAIGTVLVAISLIRPPISMSHPIQGLAFGSVLGTLVFGTPLWLIFG